MTSSMIKKGIWFRTLTLLSGPATTVWWVYCGQSFSDIYSRLLDYLVSESKGWLPAHWSLDHVYNAFRVCRCDMTITNILYDVALPIQKCSTFLYYSEHCMEQPWVKFNILNALQL